METFLYQLTQFAPKMAAKHCQRRMYKEFAAVVIVVVLVKKNCAVSGQKQILQLLFSLSKFVIKLTWKQIWWFIQWRFGMNEMFSLQCFDTCWLVDRKGIRSVKDWVLVCWWWYFDRSFAHLITPVVTTTSITLSSNKSQNGDILVPANTGPPGKWPLEWRGKCYHIRCLILFTLTVSFVIKPPLHFFMLSQFQNVAWRICSYCWCCHHHFRLSFTSLFFTRLVEVWCLWNVDMEKNG